MEKVNYILSEELKKRVSTHVISLRGSQVWIPVFFITSFFKVIYLNNKYKITNIHLGDGVLSPLGFILKILLNKKTTVTIHGLDVTYKNKIYQKIIPKFINRLDKVICISNATLNECIKRGISQEKCTVIHWGVYPNEFKVEATRADIEKIINKKISTDQKILVTVGRLVPRKGVLWFIENVLPNLSINYLYLIIGNGPDKQKISNTIVKYSLEEKVILLNSIGNEDLKVIYSASDLFIMPNIPVEGDIEGFGMVLIEAGSAGLYSIASDLEGIRDAVVKDVTGKLIENNNIKSYINEISIEKSVLNKSILNTINQYFSWEVTVGSYLDIIQN
ncbi:MAG: glycosyltransferase family 4 protein [Nitrosopumilus sp.]|nr:glycosyltransferase family 4 protein [Nitrosopumilus sp.]